MDWLKNILGDTYTEQIDAQIAEQIQKQYVPTEELETQKTNYENQIRTIRIDAAVEAGLTKAHAKNHKAARAMLDMEKIAIDTQDNVIGVDEQIQKLTTGEDTAFLFDTVSGNQFRGAKAAEKGDGKAPGEMTLETFRALSPAERYAYSVNHPNEYKQLYGGN